MNEKNLIIFSLALGSVGLYSTFVPSLHQVAMDNQSTDEKSVLREAELIGTLHLLAVAGAAAYMAKTAVPLLMAVVLGASIFVSYEYAMARVVGEKA